MKILSVIIPVYNGEEFIFKCYESISKCLLDEVEFLFIDDGSNDKSKELISECIAKDDRLTYYYQKNQGVSAARNYGMSLAKGKYISFLDIDDSFEPTFYSDLLYEIKEHNSDLVIGSFKKDTGQRLILENLNFDIDTDYYINDSFMSKYILNENTGSPWNKIYKREVIENHKLKFDENITIGEDYLFNLMYLSKSNKVRYIEKSSYIYNVRNNSAMTSYKVSKFDNYIDLHTKCLRILDDCNQQFIKYQRCRLLTWINNCLIDEINLNHSKIKKSNILNILNNEEVIKNCFELMNYTNELSLKSRIVINLVNTKSYYLVYGYIKGRNLLLNLKSILYSIK